MQSATTTLVTMLLTLGVAASGCRDVPPEAPPSGASAVADLPSPVPGGAGRMAPVLGASTAETCIQGGTPREDVRTIMGEPDSVSFGSWLYGSSEIMFGYGVVVEARNSGGNLILC